jgi:hypothetical protein
MLTIRVFCRLMLRSAAIGLLNWLGSLDEAIPAPQSLHPDWCNLHNRRCNYRCKQVCLDSDLPRGSYENAGRYKRRPF